MISRFARPGLVAVFVIVNVLALTACAAPPIEVTLAQTPTAAPPTTAPEGPAVPTPVPTEEPAMQPTPSDVNISFDMAQSEAARETAPNVAPEDMAALAADNNAFAFDLYQALRGSDGNLIASPFSISLAMAMVHAGARGSTEQQIAETMHYTLPQDRLHPAFNALDLQLEGLNQPVASDDQRFRLNIANAVWGQTGFPFSPEYLDVLARNYGAGLRLLDFMAAPEPSRMTINDWVAQETEQRIQNLIPEGSITTQTRLVLTNAIYFYGTWQAQFDPTFTQEGSFKLLDGSEVTATMMAQSAYLRYAQGNGYQAVELPYVGGETAMIVLVPDEGTFEQWEAGLDATQFAEILAALNGAQVDLTMPRYQYSSDFSLSAALRDRGMVDAFDPLAADFSGIAPVTTDQNLFITDVVHKAFVKVDESGTEAAAATGVIVGVTSIAPEPIILRIDRPFIYAIVETGTNTILFLGRVLNPTL